MTLSFWLSLPYPTNSFLSPLFSSQVIALESTQIRNHTDIFSSCVSLSTQPSLFYLRNLTQIRPCPFYYLNYAHFPDLTTCLPCSCNSFLCFQTIFYTIQRIHGPTLLRLPNRENPYSSAENAGLCLNMAYDYFTPINSYMCTHSCTHTRIITLPWLKR